MKFSLYFVCIFRLVKTNITVEKRNSNSSVFLSTLEQFGEKIRGHVGGSLG